MRKMILKAAFGTLLASSLAYAAYAGDMKPLNSDSEADRMDWSQLDAKVRSRLTK